VAPALMVVVEGVTLIDAGALIVTVPVAFNAESAVLVAVTVTVVSEVTVAGAEYKPEDETDPGPDRLQVTPVEETPARVAENCAVPP
jgi:hypothetical protein